MHSSARQRGSVMEDEYAGHGIRAIHQRGGAFEYFNVVHGLGINLNAMLIAPLLPFLSHTVVDSHDTVVAQTAHHRFRDAATCGNL